MYGSNAVGQGLGTARRRPFAGLTRGGVEPTQIATCIVRVPEYIVAGDSDAPGTCLGGRRRIFMNLHRLWINTSYFVAAKLHEEGNILGIDHDAVRTRLRGGHRDELHFACLRYEPPH